MFRHIVILLVVMMTGCAVVPDTIKVPEGTELITYTQAVTESNAVMGKPARWGGLIVGVENKPDETYIELVHFPLSDNGKPDKKAQTVGRFKVLVEGFVDPVSFESGRLATFVGSLVEPTAGMVGEQPYLYPTLKADDYHMWRNRSTYDVSSMSMGPGWGWGGGFFDPWYGPMWGIGWGPAWAPAWRLGGWGAWGWGPGWGMSRTRMRVIERDLPPRVDLKTPIKAPTPAPTIKSSTRR